VLSRTGSPKENDTDWQDRISVDPKVLVGEPVILCSTPTPILSPFALHCKACFGASGKLDTPMRNNRGPPRQAKSWSSARNAADIAKINFAA
jgi:hypothetical protein